MSVELKIKTKHLALEPAIIKCEEYKLKKQIKAYREYYQVTETDHWTLHKTHPALNQLKYKLISLISHRRWDLKNEVRATLLARAYIANKPYALVERTRKDEITFNLEIVPRVVKMVARYGDCKITEKQILQWATLNKN